jgi:hypothetical protein
MVEVEVEEKDWSPGNFVALTGSGASLEIEE